MKTISLSLVFVMMSTGCGGSDPEASATETPGGAAIGDSGGGGTDWSLDGSTSSDDPPPVVDSGSPTKSDAGAPPTDAGGKATCGTETCNATQDCCASGGTSKCVLKGTCLGGGGATCTDPSTCGGGEVCCRGLTGASCSKTCTGGLRLCTTDAQCKSGESCVSGLGVKYCGSSFSLPGFSDAATGG